MADAEAAESMRRTFGSFGERAATSMVWDDLVLAERTWLELEEALSFVRQRKRLLDDWGFGRKIARGRGTAVLFSGPPGTGKTCTAEILAAELGMDLFKIDTSRLIDKYIGETEKHLDRLFRMARNDVAALLFDEAEALFGRRVRVESSTDRYANMQTTVLLQRIEEAEGLILLTTNSVGDIDEAFRRRLTFHVQFPMPDVQARSELWEALLPPEAPVARDVDFDRLAEDFELSGGNIKNAILRAAAQAAEDDAQITGAYLQDAAKQQYRALGKLVRTPDE